MPRYYCDYCDTYLTHDSPSVRKQHNAGYKHKANVRLYYQQYEAQLNQSLIDQKVKEHLAFRPPPGPPLGVPYNPLRPGVPILPNPMMPMPRTTFPPGAPFMSVRPPVLPRPPSGPVYMSSAMPMPMPMPMPMMAPPPSGPLPGPPSSTDNMQRPPSMNPLPPIGVPPSSGPPPSFYNHVYQGAAPTSAAAPPPTGETPNNANAQSPETADN